MASILKRKISSNCSQVISHRLACCTVTCGAETLDSRPAARWSSIPRCTAYNEAFPLPREYETRKHLYNLYHLLNHLNLFGGGYLGQVKQTLRLLLGFLD